MSESAEQRRRRKALAGGLEQMATVLTGICVGVFTAGVAAPVVAVTLGTLPVRPTAAALVVAAGLLIALAALAASVTLKGYAKVLDDDHLPEPSAKE